MRILQRFARPRFTEFHNLFQLPPHDSQNVDRRDVTSQPQSEEGSDYPLDDLRTVAPSK